jgi:hypothetical protein
MRCQPERKSSNAARSATGAEVTVLSSSSNAAALPAGRAARLLVVRHRHLLVMRAVVVPAVWPTAGVQ